MTPEQFETRVVLRAKFLCRTAEPHTTFPVCPRHREEAIHQLRAETLLAPAVAADSSPSAGGASAASGGAQGRGSWGRGQAIQAPPTSAGGAPASVPPREQTRSLDERLRAPAGGTS